MRAINTDNLEKSGYPEYPFKCKIGRGYVKLFKVTFIESVSEHCYVMEMWLGCKIPPGIDIHHIDRNPSNNNIDNLMIVTGKEHRELHERMAIKRK